MLRIHRPQFFVPLVLLVLLLVPTFTLAANILPERIVPKSCSVLGGCQSICSIAELADNILKTGVVLAVFLSAALFAWAGLKMLVSPANPGQQGQAKTLFLNVLVGFLIILAAWLIIDTVMRVMLDSKVGPWNKIC